MKLTAAGFEIVGEDHDSDASADREEEEEADVFETPYSLLNSISQGLHAGLRQRPGEEA